MKFLLEGVYLEYIFPILFSSQLPAELTIFVYLKPCNKHYNLQAKVQFHFVFWIFEIKHINNYVIRKYRLKY